MTQPANCQMAVRQILGFAALGTVVLVLGQLRRIVATA
jgi:hypothetical protein